ncbi:hypothetical protein HNY73_006277 [Argiope bruennichi]|uniref:Uncharacterized protein n=1 Tax=Argiope bruennichi TaxID=94029 RepID=A0A8T0FLZ6_ARGBR|nr:hypothetical protein HNY73_006277 [Argiope bruennichi]
MASFAKHLSTHLYFHMERNHHKSGSRSSQPGTSGFTRSDLQHSPTTQRPRAWNKENSRGDLEPRGYSGYSGELVPSYDDSISAGSPRHMSSEHRGSIMGNDWPEDYFSYSPYLLTPDLSSKSRTRRRHNRRYASSSGRYEVSLDEDDDYVHPMTEHPRMRPPEPSSPIMDRRHLPPIPHSPASRDGRDDFVHPSVYPDELEQDCFIVPAHMRGRFLPVKDVDVRSHVSAQTQNPIKYFGLEVFDIQPDSPNLAPTDYPLLPFEDLSDRQMFRDCRGSKK